MLLFRMFRAFTVAPAIINLPKHFHTHTHTPTLILALTWALYIHSWITKTNPPASTILHLHTVFCLGNFQWFLQLNFMHTILPSIIQEFRLRFGLDRFDSIYKQNNIPCYSHCFESIFLFRSDLFTSVQCLEFLVSSFAHLFCDCTRFLIGQQINTLTKTLF